MKKREYKLIDCGYFDAFEVIERWIIGNKHYEKQTTTYKFRGTIYEDYTTVEWVVYSFEYDAKDELYCTRLQLHYKSIR